MNTWNDLVRAERSAAAKRLLAARRSGRHCDALLAFAALPGSRAARRLAICSALRHGDPALAEALIAQSLVRTPHDPCLLRLRSQCRMRRRRFDAAAQDLLRAVVAEPLRWGTHLALARADRCRGHLHAAQEHLAHARVLAGRIPAIADEAARCALAAGDPHAALALLDEEGRTAPASLRMRVLTACGRHREALDLAETIARTARRAAHRRAAMELLCRSGDPIRLRRLLSAIPEGTMRHPAEVLPVRLALGDFRGVIVDAFHARRGIRSGVALCHLAIAALRVGRNRLAHSAVTRLRRAAAPPPPIRSTARWLARARFVDRRHRAGTSTRSMVDPSRGLLPGLLRTLDAA
jgi:hypothetical protein